MKNCPEKRVLVADDDSTSRMILESALRKWDYEVLAAKDGTEAMSVLESEDPPRLVILDWVMPGADGLEICRQLRARLKDESFYIIILTAYRRKADLVAGLEAGADDFISKPFDPEELRARLRVGERVLGLQAALGRRALELQVALSHIKTLQGIVPICMHCHKIRSDQESWERLEQYFSAHTDAQFSHGLCPECLRTHYPEFGASNPG